MNDEHLRGELLQTEGEAKKSLGKATGDPEAVKEGLRRREAGRREEAAGEMQEILFGEPPGAEDDADGII